MYVYVHVMILCTCTCVSTQLYMYIRTFTYIYSIKVPYCVFSIHYDDSLYNTKPFFQFVLVTKNGFLFIYTFIIYKQHITYIFVNVVNTGFHYNYDKYNYI